MSSSDAFWLMVWGTVATIGFIIVIIGVTIEGVEHFKKFPRKEQSRKLQIEKIGWFLVVGGLAMEFLGDHAAKRISDREDARLNQEAGDARNPPPFNGSDVLNALKSANIPVSLDSLESEDFGNGLFILFVGRKPN